MTGWWYYCFALFLVRRACYACLVSKQIITLLSIPVLYKCIVMSAVCSLSLSNCWERANESVTCMEHYVLTAVLRLQMPVFSAVLLIMTGIIVIELLSQCCAYSEVHGLTGAWSVSEPWMGAWQLTKDRTATAAHQRAPIRLFWDIFWER